MECVSTSSVKPVLNLNSHVFHPTCTWLYPTQVRSQCQFDRAKPKLPPLIYYDFPPYSHEIRSNYFTPHPSPRDRAKPELTEICVTKPEPPALPS